MKKLRVFAFLFTLIIIPFVISIIANYTTWFGTRARVEVTLKLDGYITVGSLKESDIPELALTWKGAPIKNVLKLTWRVENSGTKGFSSFEYGPVLKYPKQHKVVVAKVPTSSPLLKLNKNCVIDRNKGQITIDDLGIFNSHDFFLIDVYITDILVSDITPVFFDKWNLEAKALDIRIQKDLAAVPDNIKPKNRLWMYVFGVLAGVFSSLFAVFISNKIIPFLSRRWLKNTE